MPVERFMPNGESDNTNIGESTTNLGGEPVGQSVVDELAEAAADRTRRPIEQASQDIAQDLRRPQPGEIPPELAGDPRMAVRADIANRLAQPDISNEEATILRRRLNQIEQEILRDYAGGTDPSSLAQDEADRPPKDLWGEGKILLQTRTEGGVPVKVVLPSDPGQLLGHMRHILNQIEETYEPQGKPEMRVDLSRLFLAMPLLKSWGQDPTTGRELTPTGITEDDFNHWKGIIRQAGNIMSEEFEYRFALHQNWVKFAGAGSIDDATAGMGGMYADQLNYILINSRKNNLLVSSAYEWFDKNVEEFLIATPEHQNEMRKKLLSDLKNKWKPKNTIKGPQQDDPVMEIQYTDADYKSAQIVGEHLYVMTARLAQRNYLVDKKYKNKLDYKDGLDKRTIDNGDASLAYNPGSGGQAQITGSKAKEWLHTQTYNNKDTYGGFPVEALLDDVDFNDKDYLSIMPSQIYEYYRDRFFEMYKSFEPVGQAYKLSMENAKQAVSAVFGINPDIVTLNEVTGGASFPRNIELSAIAFSKEELADRAANEEDSDLKINFQKRIDKMNEIFNPLDERFGSMPDEVKPELVKQWQEGELIDFNWQSLWRAGRWSALNINLPQKVADAIQKPGGYMLAKTSKALVEFAKQYDTLKGGRFSNQVKLVENYVNWRLNPPPGVGKLRPIDAEAYIANLATSLSLREGDAAVLKDAIKEGRFLFEARIIFNHLELDDVFNAFMYELITGIFKAGLSGK